VVILRSLGPIALASLGFGWVGAAACVESTFADGVFLCDPADGNEACPEGLICASDGRCRSSDVATSSGGAAGSGGDTSFGGGSSSGGSGTTAGGAGGGTGGTGATGGSGGAACVPLTCEAYSAVCGTWDDGCGALLDCGCVTTPCTVTRGPAQAKNIDTGHKGWTTPGLARVPDAQDAVASGLLPSNHTRPLWAYDYQFNIPDQAAISAIRLRVRHRAIGDGTAQDHEVFLTRSETVSFGGNAAQVAPWPASHMDRDYHWSGPIVTVAEARSAGFGAAVRARNIHASQNVSPRIDYMELAVTYSCP
jgi:hypothetical protein